MECVGVHVGDDVTQVRGGLANIKQPLAALRRTIRKRDCRLGHTRLQGPSLAKIDRSAERVRQIELQAAERL